MRKKAGLILLLLSCLLVAGCSGIRKRAGTGDVAFRLLWEGDSDLDLYVKDPAGDCIFFAQRQSPSGGILDIDCNGTMESLCEQPVENVYWPATTATTGDYIFWVHVHTVFPRGTPLPFQLQVLRGKEVFWSFAGKARAPEEILGPYILQFPEGGRVASFHGDHQPAACSLFRPEADSDPGDGWLH